MTASSAAGEDRRAAAVPVLATALVILGLWALHLPAVSLGGILHYDEFYTLERSTSFARQGDWLTVYSDNEPDFRKPPLQYWMSAALMELGVDQPAALRLPSMVFALLGLAATALLAATLLPAAPWVMPAAVLLQASSLQFWSHANSAMLDVGMAFFATVAIAALLRALRRPVWWYVVAAAITLGTLQKAPAALILVAVALLMLHLSRRRHGLGYGTLRAERHFRIALRLAFAGLLAWPVFQALLHGPDAVHEFFAEQMINRFAPEPGETQRSLAELRGLLIVGEPLLRWPAIVVALVLPWLIRRPELGIVPGILLAFALAMFLAGGSVYPRYSLLVLPLLAASLASALFALLPGGWVALAAAAAVSAASLGPVKPSLYRLDTARLAWLAERIAVLERVGVTIGGDETLVYCRGRGSDTLFPGAVTHYASSGQPIVLLNDPKRAARDLRKQGAAGPFRGVCPPAELETFAADLDGLVVVEDLHGYAIWTAGGLQQGG